MARERLTPIASGARDGVTVAWNTGGKRAFFCIINLHLLTIQALKLERGDKAVFERCTETNRAWVRRAQPHEHDAAWAVNWKRASAGRASGSLRVSLPGIYGERRPAVSCTNRLIQTEHGPELEIDMPAWAQPPSARRAAVKAA